MIRFLSWVGIFIRWIRRNKKLDSKPISTERLVETPPKRNTRPSALNQQHGVAKRKAKRPAPHSAPSPSARTPIVTKPKGSSRRAGQCWFCDRQAILGDTVCYYCK